jgi:hypothetical protein
MYLKLFLLETGRFCDRTYRLEDELSLKDVYKAIWCCFVTPRFVIPRLKLDASLGRYVFSSYRPQGTLNREHDC